MPVQAIPCRPSLHLVPPASQLDRASALAGLLGPLQDRTVLLVGANQLELMCWLMRAGSAGVTMIRHGQAIPAEPVDLVIIADVATTAMARQALLHTRAAVMAGTVVVVLFGGSFASALVPLTRKPPAATRSQRPPHPKRARDDRATGGTHATRRPALRSSRRTPYLAELEQ